MSCNKCEQKIILQMLCGCNLSMLVEETCTYIICQLPHDVYLSIKISLLCLTYAPKESLLVLGQYMIMH
jgi:hypothetical protein